MRSCHRYRRRDRNGQLTRTAGRTGLEIRDIALADGRHLRVDGTDNLRDVGSVCRYLTAHGVGAPDLAALRSALVC